MPILSRNVDLGSPIKLSPFRKVAIGTWRTAGDPSVYGVVDLDVGPILAWIEKLKERTGTKVTISHVIGRAIAKTMAVHPEINCILRFGRLYPRRHVDVFFQVATDSAGRDLSGITIRDADKKTVPELAQEMAQRVERVRNQGDPDFKQVKQLMGAMPGFLSAALIAFNSFFMYTLNLWSPVFGSPRDAFGGVMITNIGSLGLDQAFAPIVPYSRIPLLIAVGATHETPVVRNGKIEIGQVVKLCATFDHRLIDGIHAAKMVKTLVALCANPEKELA